MSSSSSSPYDSYWGWGKDHKGQNRLGHLLMSVRDSIRNKPMDMDVDMEVDEDVQMDI